MDRLRTFDNAILPADNAVPLADDGFMQAGDAFTLADDAFMLADINAFPPADFNAHALRDNAFPVPLKPGIPSKERTRRPSQRSRDL